MKIKLLKDFTMQEQTLPAGSVLEAADEVCAPLIADGTAELYDEAKEQAQEVTAVEAKALELKTQPQAVQEMKKMNVFGKMLKDVAEGKATGMSGAAVLAGTDATEVLGVIAQDSQLYGFANKVPVNGNLNVVYSTANTPSGGLPVIGLVAEGTAAGTTVPISHYEAIPGKYFATVAVTSEMLEDVPSLEAAVIRELRGNLGIAIDNSMLNGVFTNSIGFKGVLDDANALQADFADFTSPTLTELTAMTAKLNPVLQPKAVWVVNPAFWGVLEAEFLDAGNLQNQVIKSGKDKQLLGYPVILSFAVPAAAPIVFGDWTQYVIGQRREIEITRSTEALFGTDEVMLKIRCRLAGGLAAGVRKIGGVSYASIVYAGLTGS